MSPRAVCNDRSLGDEIDPGTRGERARRSVGRPSHGTRPTPRAREGGETRLELGVEVVRVRADDDGGAARRLGGCETEGGEARVGGPIVSFAHRFGGNKKTKEDLIFDRFSNDAGGSRARAHRSKPCAARRGRGPRGASPWRRRARTRAGRAPRGWRQSRRRPLVVGTDSILPARERRECGRARGGQIRGREKARGRRARGDGDGDGDARRLDDDDDDDARAIEASGRARTGAHRRR